MSIKAEKTIFKVWFTDVMEYSQQLKNENKKESYWYTPRMEEQKKSDTSKSMLHNYMTAFKGSSRTIKTNPGRENSE